VIKEDRPLNLSGDRFVVTYQVRSDDEAEARAMADFIRVEQTIEYPFELVLPGEIRDGITGQVESIEKKDRGHYLVEISYAVESVGTDLPQTLNVIYGNISFIPGVLVTRLDFPDSFLENFKGPRFGRDGIRDLVEVYHRPLISTALKPIGLSSEQLAEMAYQCALGGLDIIKDDHGLSLQQFAPFNERVSLIVEAVRKASKEAGTKTLYFANVSGPIDQMVEKAGYALQAGVDGLMVLPGLYSIEFFRLLAEDENLALPMMFHPGFMGIYRNHQDSGISPFVLHGQISRLCGADITIFPHFGGRFSPSMEASRRASDGTAVPMGCLKPNLPCPGGGVKPGNFIEMTDFYGKDAVFLAAGNLHRSADNLIDASRAFRKIAESIL
jgi:ribulose-bisphosphate carboxylase large chain